MSNFTVNRKKFDRSQAEEQFSKYKETGDGKIITISEGQVGYSEAYAEGWQRIFGKKDEEIEEEKQ